MISYMFNTDMNSTEIQDFKKQTKKQICDDTHKFAETK